MRDTNIGTADTKIGINIIDMLSFLSILQLPSSHNRVSKEADAIDNEITKQNEQTIKIPLSSNHRSTDSIVSLSKQLLPQAIVFFLFLFIK